MTKISKMVEIFVISISFWFISTSRWTKWHRLDRVCAFPIRCNGRWCAGRVFWESAARTRESTPTPSPKCSRWSGTRGVEELFTIKHCFFSLIFLYWRNKALHDCTWQHSLIPHPSASNLIRPSGNDWCREKRLSPTRDTSAFWFALWDRIPKGVWRLVDFFRLKCFPTLHTNEFFIGYYGLIIMAFFNWF